MSIDRDASERPWPPLGPTLFAIVTVALLGVVSPVEELTRVGRPWIAVGVAAVVLVVSLGRTDAPGRAVGWFLASAVALSAVGVGLLIATEQLWLAALGLGLVGATLSYGLHRYERLRLGLVEEVRP